MKFINRFIYILIFCQISEIRSLADGDKQDGNSVNSDNDPIISQGLLNFRQVRPSEDDESLSTTTEEQEIQSTSAPMPETETTPAPAQTTQEIPKPPTPTDTDIDKSQDSKSSDKSASSGLNSVILDEICEEPIGDNEKLTRKEKLLCAALKVEMEIREINQNQKLSPLSQIQAAQESVQIEKEPEDEDFGYLPKGYNKQAAPTINIPKKLDNGTVTIIKRPVTCMTYLNIRSVIDMDEAKEEVTLDLDIYTLWLDGHIMNTLRQRNVTGGKLTEVHINLRPMSRKAKESIWTPDIFFEEVVKVVRPVVFDEAGKVVLFNPTLGAIVLRARLLVTLHCDMDFKYYPADTQICEFHIRSASHESGELALRWWRNKAFGVYLHEASDTNFDYQITTIKEYDEAVNIGPETRAGRTNSYLWFEIRFRRKMSYHLLQTYLPSVFFIIVTWLCFLIPTKMFEARIGVAMTTLLTQTSMFSSIRDATPAVGYVKAIDIWMVTCILFIFSALGAFTCGAWMRQARNQLRDLKAAMEDKVDRESTTGKLHRRLSIYNFFGKFLEKFTAAGLSLTFFIFCVTYWSLLLSNSEYLDWKANSTFNRIFDDL